MTKFGQVKAYDEQTGMATIVYQRPDACEKCVACGAQSHTGTISLQARCKQGDWVKVELPESSFLKATALAYALPLIGLLGGLALGYALGGGADGWTLLGGGAGLCLCVLLLRMNERRISHRAEWTPRVVQVYAQKPDLGDIGCDGVQTAFQK